MKWSKSVYIKREHFNRNFRFWSIVSSMLSYRMMNRNNIYTTVFFSFFIAFLFKNWFGSMDLNCLFHLQQSLFRRIVIWLSMRKCRTLWNHTQPVAKQISHITVKYRWYQYVMNYKLRFVPWVYLVYFS